MEAVSYLTSQQTVRESRKWKKRSGRFFLLGQSLELLLEAFCARRGVLVKGINVVVSRQTETYWAIHVTAGLSLDLTNISLYLFISPPSSYIL